MNPDSTQPADLQASLAGGLDLNLLLTLDALLEIRSVTATAERFGVTQSAMSHRLARIREFFGDPLLVSAGEDLVLTPKAAALETPLRVALQELRDALVPSDDFNPAEAERAFVIAASDLAEVLPALLEHLGRVAPWVSIRMAGRGLVNGETLAASKVDFAVAPVREVFLA
jgi:DNA-binding transcriptional LysR family regulator